jgi:acyl-CoA thioesterase
MTVRADMIQGHGTCHGGFLFALADSAFAFACNSYDEATVALGCSIDYVAPALRGDQLTASASEQSRKGRTGNYDVRIENQQGELIALFHGKSYKVRGTVLAQETPMTEPPPTPDHRRRAHPHRPLRRRPEQRARRRPGRGPAQGADAAPPRTGLEPSTT